MNNSNDGMLFGEFVARYSFLTEADFLKQFNHPFLIQLSKEVELAENPGFGTISGNLNRIMVESELTNCKLIFVTKRSTNAFSMMVTVGRAENNDIVLRNGKISKFHAYFNESGSDWSLTDGNSSNGTYLHNQRLTPNTRYPIPDGSDLSFSQDLSFRFVSNRGMYDRMRRAKPN